MRIRHELPQITLYTIGHSTRKIELFVALLMRHQITMVADVRSIPFSEHNPQFNQDSLIRELCKRGINYIHLKGLGGFRHPKKDSINLGWKNASFRGFADYMQTPEFGENLCDLIALALKEKRVALMCAEAVYWRCHRSLISDALIALGIPVEHILSETNVQPHKITAWAKIKEGKVTYPGEKS